MGLPTTLATYGRYYLTTSFAYDAFRAGANAALVLTLGGRILRLLERYRARFIWQPWTPLPLSLSSTLLGSATRCPRRRSACHDAARAAVGEEEQMMQANYRRQRQPQRLHRRRPA